MSKKDNRQRPPKPQTRPPYSGRPRFPRMKVLPDGTTRVHEQDWVWNEEKQEWVWEQTYYDK